VLRRTLDSLAAQSCQPARIIVIDASERATSTRLCGHRSSPGLKSQVTILPAEKVGAACQRNQGVKESTEAYIGFCDDDVLFEPKCFERLWTTLECQPDVGGVSTMITNQRYQSPGVLSRCVFGVMAGRREKSYAGRVLGPAINLLPEDRDDLPEVVPVDWLNLGCTIYRRCALPNPPFPACFTGYSLMEDLSLSITVSRRWKLANVRSARIYHDSQPGPHKSNPAKLATMELVNRHYVMTQVLGSTKTIDYVKLLLWEVFGLTSSLRTSKGWAQLFPTLFGKLRAVKEIIRTNRHRPIQAPLIIP